MNILFKVNQHQALLRGINAPHSTVRVTIDPTVLDQQAREMLAENLGSDLDATKGNLLLTSPDYAGVIEAIADLIRKDVAVQEANAASKAEEVAKEAAKVAAIELLQGECEQALAELAAGGALTEIAIPWSLRTLGGSLVAYKTAWDEVLQARASAKRARELEAKEQADQIADLAKQAKAEAVLDVLKKAGSQELMKRMAAGLAPEEEIEQTVHDYLLGQLDIAPGHVEWDSLNSVARHERNAKLSAPQFARYQRLVKTMPEIIEKEILAIQSWREARDGEEGDADNEVLVNAGKWLRITWRDAATGTTVERGYRLDSKEQS